VKACGSLPIEALINVEVKLQLEAAIHRPKHKDGPVLLTPRKGREEMQQEEGDIVGTAIGQGGTWDCLDEPHTPPCDLDA
jgi:hypothetical protein